MGTKLGDKELWEIAGKRGDHQPDVGRLLAHIEWQESEIAKARTLEVVDLARVTVKPGDTLLVRPARETGFLDSSTASELKRYLEAQFPGVRVLVIAGLTVDVSVIEGANPETEETRLYIYGLRNPSTPDPVHPHPYMIDLATVRADLARPENHTIKRGTELVRRGRGSDPWEVVLVADGERGWTEPARPEGDEG